MPDHPDHPDQPDPFELFGLDPDEDRGSGRSGGDAGRPRPDHDPRDDDPRYDDRYDDDPRYADRYDEAPAGAGRRVRPAAADLDDEPDDGEFVSVRSGRGGARRWGLALLGLFVVLVLVVGIGAFWVRSQVDPGNPGEAVELTIPSGSTSSEVASLLADKGIITNATVFEWYLRFKGDPTIQAGDYEGLRRHSSMGDVVEVLDRGPAPPKDVTFLVREGLWESETRQLILDTFSDMTPAALDAALAGTHPSIQPPGSSDLEGFLYPATYQVPVAQAGDAQALVDQMVAAFERTAAETGLADAATTLQGAAGRMSISPYQALIVASMVEAEAKIPEDRPKIARVIYNRLAAGMTLGFDTTVVYALQERTAELTASQLQIDSPYNTRTKTGLPPTPIASPGQASIEAALHPAEGSWLYFVLYEEDGHQYFADTFDEFQRAVKDAQARGVF